MVIAWSLLFQVAGVVGRAELLSSVLFLLNLATYHQVVQSMATGSKQSGMASNVCVVGHPLAFAWASIPQVCSSSGYASHRWEVHQH